ncbi:MAG: DUF1501 domain-containing protein [Planctomycetota bacterium]|nr:MAG: DUF1501 domain-containing protein [Planctomycetota bacterium]REK37973.1 MAG: DUF1501 domain-containing protein [Planctomycetota bacterium]
MTGPQEELRRLLTRRYFFGTAGSGIGAAALTSLLAADGFAAAPEDAQGAVAAKFEPPAPRGPDFAPRAKRVIYIFQSGGPAQLDMLEYKPRLRQLHGTDLPESVRGNQRLTSMTSDQPSFPVASSYFDFQQHGECGTWLSSLLPHTGRVVDDLCLINSMHTEAINHDNGITLLLTGRQQPGLPSMGSWISYGLGSISNVLPAFVVLMSNGSSQRKDVLPLHHRLWGNGFLDARHQGVKFRSGADPVLYLNDPSGLDRSEQRRLHDRLARLNQLQYERSGDPEILARVAQYELAFRMQRSVPELMDLSGESQSTFTLYGERSRTPGTYAANCLLARRMIERGVRFVQLFHRGWDQHDNLPADLRRQCGDIDQADAALITDLKQRGLLEDTLVVWATEFGRTVYCQGKLERNNYGRDHHPRSFSAWLAGAGVRGGMTYGKTDEYGYNIVENPVHLRDLNATILHLLGIDHKKLTFKFQGLDQRLTGVDEEAHVVRDLLT